MKFSEAFEKWQKEGGFLINGGRAYKATKRKGIVSYYDKTIKRYIKYYHPDSGKLMREEFSHVDTYEIPTFVQQINFAPFAAEYKHSQCDTWEVRKELA